MRNVRFEILFVVCALALTGFLPLPAMALEPEEILVVANRNAQRSVGLAKYYMQKRGIPDENLLKLWVTDKEACSREIYDKKIAKRIKKKLLSFERLKRPRCLALMYGVPLKVGPLPLTPKQQEQINSLNDENKFLKKELEIETLDSERKEIKLQIDVIKKKIKNFKLKHNTGASVDSELALVLAGDYPLSLWVVNPFFIGFKKEKNLVSKDDVLMVSRLDGPTPKIVKRIIGDSIATEKTGLSGKAYFDARWPKKEKVETFGYGFYDRSIHRAADLVNKSGRMPVQIEQTKELFGIGECPNASLYCGWYSLANYIDAFTWTPGAVGYHIASSECATLKRTDSRVWCKRMLDEGIAATIGPVGEPYVQSFPVPEIFFRFLVDGYLTLAECYQISLPYLSWKMVLIGDPLYRPFKTLTNAG